MKCEACLNLLEEFSDGELLEHDAAQVSAHLITCASCANEFEVLGAEQEIYARYDRGLEISPALWTAVEARIVPPGPVVVSNRRSPSWLAGLFVPPAFGVSFAGATAVLIAAAVIGVAYLRTHPQSTLVATVNDHGPIPGSTVKRVQPTTSDGPAPPVKVSNHVPVKHSPTSSTVVVSKPDPQSDVLDVASTDLEDRDTQRHIEQAQNLLRSVRNLQPADGADDVDVSYEKALSRRLLNENVILRRDAEMSGKFPAKTLLSDLEPFLIDIANLPDKAGSDDLRVIRERVKNTEIVAALQGY